MSSCRLQLSQPRAPQRQPKIGYDSGLLHDAALQSIYADMISDQSCIFHDMTEMPDSTPEALWQHYKSGLQRCADALLRRETQPRAPWISDKTWSCVQHKQDSYKAFKHAESDHEKSVLHRQYRQALNDSRRSVKSDKRAYWKGKAIALEADFAANRVHAAYKRVGLRDE